MNKNAVRFAALLTCVLGSACTFGIAAEAKTITFNQVNALLVDLGYEPKISDGTVSVEDLGPSKVTVRFVVNADNSLLNIYSNWTIPADKQADVPSVDMLKANNSAPFAFALYDKDGGLGMDLEASYDASLVNKTMLRKTIDQLLDTINSDEALWNSDKWAAATTTAGAGDKSYKSLQDEADAAWEKAPLTVQNLVFTQDKVESYRAYKERPNTVFAHGDKIHVYFEPIDYTWKPLKEGGYNVSLSADFAMKTKGGDSILDNKNAVTLATDFHYKMKVIDFEMNVSLGDSLPVTDYVATITLHDRNSGKDVTKDLAFSIQK